MMEKARNIISRFSRTIFIFLIYSICFLLPFQPKFLATVEIFTVLFYIIGHSPKYIWNKINSQKAIIAFILFFAITATSYFFSDNKTEAGRQVEVKLAFLIIPLLLFGSVFDKKKSKTAIIVFIAGCALACIVLLGLAAYDFIKNGNESVFVYTEFSRFMHVSYFSMYLLICFGWLFMVAMEDNLLYPKSHYLLMALYAICLVLISAKIMLLAFIASSFLFAGYYAMRKKRIGAGIGIIAFFIFMPVLLYFVSPNLKTRIDFFVLEMKNINQETAPENMGSAKLRVIIWKDASTQIEQNLPFGIGSGDVQGMLIKNFEKRGMQTAIEKKLNMHNEYLQQLAGLGIAGFLLFITIILLPALICYRPYRFIGILFSFTTATVSLTESILERQAGTIFICLIGILLMITYRKEDKTVPNS